MKTLALLYQNRNKTAISTYLERFDLSMFSNVDYAVDHYQRLKPTIIMIDHDMPNSCRVTQTLIQHFRKTPIVLIADHPTSKDVFDAVAMGCRGFFGFQELNYLEQGLLDIVEGGFYLTPEASNAYLKLMRFIKILSFARFKLLSLLLSGKKEAEIKRYLELDQVGFRQAMLRLKRSLSIDTEDNSIKSILKSFHEKYLL